MNERDLSMLDRNTLRAWRIGNLLIWGLVGMVAAGLIATLASRLFVGLASSIHSVHLPFAAAVLPALALAGVVDGLIVGSKVYRSPVLVSLGVFAIPGVVSLLALAGGRLNGAELLAFFLAPGIIAVVAAIVATMVWRRRPAALRGGPSVQAPAASGQPHPTS